MVKPLGSAVAAKDVDGEVYEKDLGKNTIQLARMMDRFDPDMSWKKVERALTP